MNGFFLFRIGYILLCWLILLAPITTSNKLATICSSLLLFYIPLIFDYWSHEPLTITEKDRRRRKVGVITPVIFSTVCIAVLILDSQGLDFFNNILISILKYILWGVSGWFVYLAIEDFIAYSDNEEIEIRAQKREEHRQQAVNGHLSLATRQEFYQKNQTKKHVMTNSKKKRRKRK